MAAAFALALLLFSFTAIPSSANCYAVNSYFQKKGQAPGTCDFAGTATPVASDPSVSGCVFPSSSSGAGTSTTTFHHHHLHPLSNKKRTAYNPSLPVPPFSDHNLLQFHHSISTVNSLRLCSTIISP
ncbi:unnamed protein product [Vicia faba]|uniref:X8 domain-containing protein n=1 Tax=Vicia faba TaxID=3906 RepID=A0AAV1A2J6_VICFA|nr:unnamed protein product [Vicia faba]